MARPLLEPPMAALPPGRKTLPREWWRGEIEPGTTLLARHLKRELRARRGYINQDERLQRRTRSYARWLWHQGMWNELREPGHA